MTFSQVNVRMPSGLKGWLKEQAIASRRSFTQEVVLRLSESRKRHGKSRRHQDRRGTQQKASQ